MSRVIDDLKEEKSKLHEIMYEQILATSSADSSINLHNQQNIAYLIHEVETNAVAFADTLVNEPELWLTPHSMSLRHDTMIF